MTNRRGREGGKRNRERERGRGRYIGVRLIVLEDGRFENERGKGCWRGLL